MLGGGLTVTDHGDGTFTLTNAKGVEADVDTVKGIVTMEDMPVIQGQPGAVCETAGSRV